jgi:hypothetical protein
MLMLGFKREIISRTCDSFQDDTIHVLIDKLCDFLQHLYDFCPCMNPFSESLL